MIDELAVPLVVVHCGRLSPALCATLEQAGFVTYDASEPLESLSPAAVLVQYDEMEQWRNSPLLECAPTILLANRIDSQAVVAAATIGALDVVLAHDQPHLLAALGRAVDVLRNGAALSESDESELLRRVLDLTPNYVSVRDDTGRIVALGQAFADFYATTVEEMIGKTFDAFLSPEDLAIELAEDRDVLRSKRSKVTERDVVDRSGARRRLQIIKRPLTLSPANAYVLAVGVDVTRRHRTEMTLENTNDFLKSVLETISDAVFALDISGKFTLMNGRLCDLTGYAQHELLGMPLTKIFAPLSLLEAKRSVSDAISGAHVDGDRQVEGRIAHAEGIERIISYSLRPLMRNGSIAGIVGTAKDVTERRSAERRIEHLAYHDPLTNLPNRRLLDDRLQIAIAQARRDGRGLALLFLDLDRFKAINDSLGHRTGDLLLQELAARLRGCVRAGDTIARMGGDEFLLLVQGLDHEEDAVDVAQTVLGVVRQPFFLEGRELIVTASIGISIFSDGTMDGDMLIRHADIALFACKRRGRDQFWIYDEGMSAQTNERFELEHDLRRAIRDEEFEMFYQPIVDMRNGSTVALEALVRWHHPTRGLLLPTVFVELAEQIGLIGRIGEWVLFTAAAQAAAWQAAGVRPVPIAVNVSARQFDGPIVSIVADALKRTGLDPKYLTLELTESVLVESAAGSTRTIEELKELGVRIGIDDFGTGYSSLSYLERFPIDTIKIDRSFLPLDAAGSQMGLIASAIVSLGQGLELRVIAEGIETAAQRDFLLARGCSLGQGFLYAPAMTAGEVEPLLNGDLRDRVLA